MFVSTRKRSRKQENNIRQLDLSLNLNDSWTNEVQVFCSIIVITFIHAECYLPYFKLARKTSLQILAGDKTFRHCAFEWLDKK